MLPALSGMLPDDICVLDDELCSRLAGNTPARASKMLALPNRAALFTRTRNRDHEFAVFLGHEVFGAAR